MDRDMRKRKIILFYLPCLGLGGVVVSLMNLIHHLEASGFECKVLLPYKEKVDDPHQFDVVPRRYLAATAWGKPLRSNRLKQIIKLLNILSGWRFFFIGVPKVQHDIFVVYQIQGNEHWVRYTNKPCFGWMHGLASGGSGARGKLTRWDVRRSLSRFTRLVAVSYGVAENWKSLYQLRTSPDVILNLFDVSRMITDGMVPQSDIKPSDRPQVIFLGRLYREKGIFRLLTCLNKLVDACQIQFDLWVIGIGGKSIEEQLQKFVQESSLKGLVHFLGYKSNPYPYLKAADLLVVPSYEEGFGLVIWEALLQRCHVIATDAGGCAQALNYGSWGMVVKNDDEAIYQGLRKFFTESSAVCPNVDFDHIRDCIKEINDLNKKRIEGLFMCVSKAKRRAYR